MTEPLQAEVCRIVADLFELDPGPITPATSPETIEAWDSLQHLNLVIALEQAFEVAFTPEEIEEMVSVAAIVRIVATRLGAGAARAAGRG
jgi:acyl carrier protein